MFLWQMEIEMPEAIKTAAIILAAGRGMRMGDAIDGPKQYQPLDHTGLTVLGCALDTFLSSPAVDRVQVVIHPDDVALYEAIAPDHPKLLEPVFGGSTRQESGLAGLEALDELSPLKILIHDAARPFLSHNLIEEVIAGIEDGQCALPATAVSDTVKRAGKTPGGLYVTGTLPREEIHLAQTPQGFVFRAILESHQRARSETLDSFTDDCAIAEWAGMRVRLVPGETSNIKITTIEDLHMASKTQEAQAFRLPDVRTGNGYDVHRLVEGDGVILCGIKLPGDRKLDGHSDADVALHAITDALLGTVGEGDIGSHFPPSDPVWKGAASHRFLEHACAIVREKGGVISHLDVTIICEMPKVGPYREEMRKRVADICGIDVARVSVKATTHERIGTIGRGEGISAMATASVVIAP